MKAMDSNDPPNDPGANPPNPTKKKKFNNWNWNRRRNTEPKQRPIAIAIPRQAHSSGANTDDSGNGMNENRSFEAPAAAVTSFEIGGNDGGYVAWKIYFPNQGKKTHSFTDSEKKCRHFPRIISSVRSGIAIVEKNQIVRRTH